MIANRICWILLTLLLAVMCIFAGNPVLLALFVTVLLLPVITALCSFAVRNKLKIEIVSIGNMEKCKTQVLCVTLSNTGAFPVHTAQIEVSIRNVLTGEHRTVTLRSAVMPKKSHVFYIDLESRHCGRLKVQAGKLKLYDCFGLRGIASKNTALGSATVQPDTFHQRITVTANVNCTDDSEVYSDVRPGYDLTEPFQLRDYRQGDGMRQIHWKLTEKFDRLIVKDPSLTVTRSILVFWERRTDELVPERQDAQGEVVVSLCKALIEDGNQFKLGWNDSKTGFVVIREIRNMDDLIGAVTALMSSQVCQSGETGAEIFYNTYGDNSFSHIVYITEKWTPAIGTLANNGRVQVIFCGEPENSEPETDATCFSADNYQQKLMELEI